MTYIYEDEAEKKSILSFLLCQMTQSHGDERLVCAAQTTHNRTTTKKEQQ